jgi:hypothetical protein
MQIIDSLQNKCVALIAERDALKAELEASKEIVKTLAVLSSGGAA